MRSLLRAALFVALGLLALQAWRMLSDRTGEPAPPFTGGVWAADAEPPALVDGRPAGWTLYAFFSPT